MKGLVIRLIKVAEECTRSFKVPFKMVSKHTF